MVLYNTTILDNSTNLYEIATSLNDLSGGIFALMLLITVTLILIIMFRYSGDMKKVLLGVGFLMSILSVLFWTLGFIGLNVLIIPLVFLMVSIFINIWGF